MGVLLSCTMPDPMTIQDESDHFSPYRADGKLYGFVCVVTGANMPVGSAIVTELAAHGAAGIYACTTTDQPSGLQSSLLKLYPNTKIIDYPYSISSEQDTLTLIDEAPRNRTSGWREQDDQLRLRELQFFWHLGSVATLQALTW